MGGVGEKTYLKMKRVCNFKWAGREITHQALKKKKNHSNTVSQKKMKIPPETKFKSQNTVV